MTSRRSPFFSGLIQLDGDGGHDAGDRRADLAGVRGVGLDSRLLLHVELLIADVDFAGLAVQFEEDGASAVGVRFADGEELDHQRLAGFELDGDIVAALHAVVELGRREHVDVAPVLAGAGELQEDVRVHEIAQHLVVRGLASDLLLQRRGRLVEIDRGQMCAGAAALRFGALAG